MVIQLSQCSVVIVRVGARDTDEEREGEEAEFGERGSRSLWFEIWNIV